MHTSGIVMVLSMWLFLFSFRKKLKACSMCLRIWIIHRNTCMYTRLYTNDGASDFVLFDECAYVLGRLDGHLVLFLCIYLYTRTLILILFLDWYSNQCMYRIRFQTGYFIISYIQLDLIYLHMQKYRHRHRLKPFIKTLCCKAKDDREKMRRAIHNFNVLCFLCAFCYSKMPLFI